MIVCILLERLDRPLSGSEVAHFVPSLGWFSDGQPRGHQYCLASRSIVGVNRNFGARERAWVEATNVTGAPAQRSCVLGSRWGF